jgi:hypothetical protein
MASKIKFDDLSDEELGGMFRDRYNRLKQAHADGIADEHPKEQWNRDNVVLRAAKAAGAAQDDNDKPAATYPTEGGGASDAAMRSSWSKASAPVRMALDACGLDVGRSVSDSLAVASAHLRQSGWDAELMTELKSYHSAATAPRGAAAATRRMIPGLDRLK